MRRRPIRMYESSRVSVASEYIRGEGVLGLAVRNDRMLVERASQSHEGSSAGYLGITMEITTRLGSHTIAVASFVGRFVSTCASDTAPRSLGAAVSSSFTYLVSPFRVLPYGRRWNAHMHGRTREKANDLRLSYSFVPSASRGAIAFLIAIRRLDFSHHEIITSLSYRRHVRQFFA